MSGLTSEGIDERLLAALGEVGLAKEYIKRLVIKHTLASEHLQDEAHEAALDQYKKANNINDDDDLKQHLKICRMTMHAMEDLATTNLRISRYAENNYAGHAQVTFAKQRQSLSKILFSLCSVKDKGLAAELFMRIETGESNFSVVAERFAEGPERQTKGVLGPLLISKINQALANKLLDAGPGKLIGPLLNGHSWIIARLECYYPVEYDDTVATKFSRQSFLEQVNRRAQAILNNTSQSFAL